jgi:alkylhydroperoxidase family enzyme
MAKLEAVVLEANPQLAEVFSKVEASRGWVSNLMRTVAHTPQGLQHYSRLGHYARYDSDLTEIQRELSVVTTVRGVRYGWVHHGGLARQLGITSGQLAEIEAGRVPADLPVSEQALVRFVLAFASFKGVPQATLDALREHFSARQIVDISLISAYYLAAGAIITGFGVELEGPEILQIELDWQSSRMAG